jgi:hypothetical protein
MVKLKRGGGFADEGSFVIDGRLERLVDRAIGPCKIDRSSTEDEMRSNFFGMPRSCPSACVASWRTVTALSP